MKTEKHNGYWLTSVSFMGRKALIEGKTAKESFDGALAWCLEVLHG